ncbi:hypothetical protein QJS10_CPB12g01242 [Acorus calamus]|uniref:Uncharacterized protein n=1 Tax=Acorus calamus TaxID=4465 RepID=A0AAV9DKC6_ACOCL|nr:hypothetical protein QJS10_CPB12g01242 [Acorus calamus]
MTKAHTLPKACGVKVHHKPHCGAPTPAPALAPAPEPPKPPTPSPSPSPSPDAPVTPSSQPPAPSPTQTTSGAPVVKISSTVALLGLMVSAFAYFF